MLIKEALPQGIARHCAAFMGCSYNINTLPPKSLQTKDSLSSPNSSKTLKHLKTCYDGGAVGSFASLFSLGELYPSNSSVVYSGQFGETIEIPRGLLACGQRFDAPPAGPLRLKLSKTPKLITLYHSWREATTKQMTCGSCDKCRSAILCLCFHALQDGRKKTFT